MTKALDYELTPENFAKFLAAADSVSANRRHYFVTSIATAAAARFMDDPKSAPGTPSLAKNAEFLRSHKSDLARLQAQRERKLVVTTTP